MLSSIKGEIVSLQVDNFKSYSGKQTIGPFNRFTSVIGPNGSGKSNIMDALAFVLGVQARHLRVANLKEHIHRKESENLATVSLGRSASVTMFFRYLNEGADGIIQKTMYELTRKISPDGASKFYINGKHVLFDDYTRQLSDWNILVSARNFLVFQGDVEDVAQKDPKDLARLIAVVSGSADLEGEFDIAEAERALCFQKKTVLNSQKGTLRKEIDDMKEQKADADDYQRSQVRVKMSEQTLFLTKLKSKEDNAVDIVTSIQKEKDMSETKRDQYVLLEKEEASLVKTRAGYKIAVKPLNERCNKIKDELTKLQNAETRAEAEITALNKTVTTGKETVNKFIQNLSNSQNRKKIQSDLVTSSIANLDTKISYWAEQISNEALILNDEDKLQFDIILKEGMIKHAEQSVQLKESQADISRFETRVTEAETEAHQFAQRIEVSQNEVRSEKLKLEELKRRLIETQDEMESQEKILHPLETSMASLNDKLSRLTLNIKQSQEKRDIAHACLRDRRATDDQFRVVEELKSLFKNDVIGRLPDLLRVSREHDTALVSALGKYNQAIVVSTLAVAEKAGKYCRDHQKGYFQFLPLDRLKEFNNVALSTFCASNMDCTLFVDLVSFDDSLKNAVYLALGDTIFTQTLSTARILAYEKLVKSDLRAKVVVQSGARINKNLSMTYEDVTSSANQRGRGTRTGAAVEQTKFDDINKSLEKFQNEEKDIKLVISEESEKLSLAQHRISHLRTTAATLAQQVATTEELISLKETRLGVLLSKQAKLKLDIESHLASVASANDRLTKASKTLERLTMDSFAPLASKLGISPVVLLSKVRKTSTLENERDTELKELEGEVERHKHADERLTVEIAQMQSKLDAETKRVDLVDKKLQEAKKNLLSITNKIESEKTNLKNIQMKLQEETTKETKTDETLASVREQLRVITLATTESKGIVSRLELELQSLRDDWLEILREALVAQVEVPLLSEGEKSIRSITNGFTGASLKRKKQINNSRHEKKNNNMGINSRRRQVDSSEDEEEERDVDMDTQEEEHDDINLSHHSDDNTIKQKIENLAFNISPDQVPSVFSLSASPVSQSQIQIDYSILPSAAVSALRHSVSSYISSLAQSIVDDQAQLETRRPNLLAASRLVELEEQEATVDDELKKLNPVAAAADKAFRDVRKNRERLFTQCFTFVRDSIKATYSQLTRRHDGIGGDAHLDFEETPGGQGAFDGVMRFNVMPPSKRFRDMSLLSGGEKTMAALSLLFALHSFRPSPFLVLDEVDAALDPRNVHALAGYLKNHFDGQVLVISLKEKLFCQADTLVGTSRDKVTQSSKTFTLKLSHFSNMHKNVNNSNENNSNANNSRQRKGGTSWTPPRAKKRRIDVMRDDNLMPSNRSVAAPPYEQDKDLSYHQQHQHGMMGVSDFNLMMDNENNSDYADRAAASNDEFSVNQTTSSKKNLRVNNIIEDDSNDGGDDDQINQNDGANNNSDDDDDNDSVFGNLSGQRGKPPKNAFLSSNKRK